MCRCPIAVEIFNIRRSPTDWVENQMASARRTRRLTDGGGRDPVGAANLFEGEAETSTRAAIDMATGAMESGTPKQVEGAGRRMVSGHANQQQQAFSKLRQPKSRGQERGPALDQGMPLGSRGCKRAWQEPRIVQRPCRGGRRGKGRSLTSGLAGSGQRTSARVFHASLLFDLGFRRRLSGKLKDGRFLALAQMSQEERFSIGKLERIMVSMRRILVDLPEDRRPVTDCLVLCP